MLLDARELPDDGHDTTICIAGTGPAGLTIATRLAARGLDVCVLEAGGAAESPASQQMYQGEASGLPYFDLDDCRRRMLGGSSHCWGGYCRPFEPLDFEERPGIPFTGWPFSFDEIEPHLKEAHRISGLGPVNYSYPFWAARTGQPPSPFSGPHITPEIRQKSRFSSAELLGELQAAPNVRVIVNAPVVEVQVDASGRTVTGVTVADDRRRKLTIRAGLYVLAVGGIENARLLLASRRVQKAGVGNDRDLVGRFFMEHVAFDAGLFRPRDVALFARQLEWRPADGVMVRNSLAVDEGVRRADQLLRCFFHLGDQSVTRTYGYRSLMHVLATIRRGGFVPNARYHLKNLLWDRRAVIAAAAWRLKLRRGDPGATGMPGVFRLRVTAEPAPDPDSRVTLAGDRDRLGVPKAHLHWRINGLTYAHVRRSLELFRQDVEQLRLGGVEIWPSDAWPTRGTYHHMGTTRMHDSPAQGVVDGDCRVHGYSNLFVAGSSVFPTAGSGTPTLMIIVLALRLADHVAARAARSDF